jgi:ubiquinone biosynthesis monooxygenase Coq7
MRHFGLVEKLIFEIDNGLRSLAPPSRRPCQRTSPAENLDEPSLNTQERQHVAGLVRVNHSGEVCAQALYQGQALTAQLAEVRAQMDVAANEEIDHLAWCEQRLEDLGSQPSLLNPFWYLGSLLLGALAGMAGDKISLGFVAETELQVTAHLQNHLEKLPSHDQKTRAILEEMQKDEAEHAKLAKMAGGAELPSFVKALMQGMSKLMTFSSYHL